MASIAMYYTSSNCPVFHGIAETCKALRASLVYMYVYCISVVDNYIRQHTHQDWSAWSRCQLLTVNRYHHLIINKLNKETKYMEFTFIFRPPNPWPFCHLDFPQFETKITQETTFLLYAALHSYGSKSWTERSASNEGKVKQMQPMWLCILLCKHFKDTFEDTQ